MNSSKKFKIICLPFAGASKYAYAQFSQHAPDYIEFQGLDIPGRGTRFTEKPLTHIDDMVEDLFKQLKPLINEDYALYGHSMGTILAQRLCERLSAENMRLPKRLFLSGRGGPNTETTDRKWHLLPSAEFRIRLSELGGSPKEVLENEDLMNLLEPILRSDFEAVENYVYPEVNKLNLPVSVFYGTKDRCSKQESEDWQSITTAPISLHEFEGDHFFIFTSVENFVQTMINDLESAHSVA